MWLSNGKKTTSKLRGGGSREGDSMLTGRAVIELVSPIICPLTGETLNNNRVYSGQITTFVDPRRSNKDIIKGVLLECEGVFWLVPVDYIKEMRMLGRPQ
jgi:hypothetical protein